jgi:hypothetical protein
MAKAHACYLGWIAGRRWKNKNKWHAQPPKYCMIFIVVTQFANVASGRIVLSGGLLVGDTYSSSIGFGGEDKALLL